MELTPCLCFGFLTRANGKHCLYSISYSLVDINSNLSHSFNLYVLDVLNVIESFTLLTERVQPEANLDLLMPAQLNVITVVIR